MIYYLLIALSLTITKLLIFQGPLKAENIKFICETSHGKPNTVAKHPKHGDISIIDWSSDHFFDSNYNLQKKCKIVSEKFQDYHNQGLLNYLTTGRVNKQPVICVAESKNSGCAGVLFEFNPGSSPTKTLIQLMDIHEICHTSYCSNYKPLHDIPQRIYIDFNQYLKKKAHANSSESNSHTPSPINRENSNNGEVLW